MEHNSDKTINLIFSGVSAIGCVLLGFLFNNIKLFAIIWLLLFISFIEVRKTVKKLMMRYNQSYDDEEYIEEAFEEEETVEIIPEEIIEETIEETVEETILPRAKLMREEDTRDNYKVDLEEVRVYVSNVEQLDGIDDHKFENYCYRLLSKIGYEVKNERSNGIDLIATNAVRRYVIVCKQSTTPLTEEDILKVEEGKNNYPGYIGVIMTNAIIPSEAVRLGNSKGLILWDRAAMSVMIGKVKGEISLLT